MVIFANDFAKYYPDEMPVKVISLVPSLTEVFYSFGLGEYIVGITRFCEYPTLKPNLPAIIGGTKNPSIDRIKSLTPDVVFASKEENNKEDIELISRFSNVVVTDIKTIQDNLIFLESVISCFPVSVGAENVLKNIRKLYQFPVIKPLRRALYLIWKDPYMTVGKDTFIHEMMGYSGFCNVADDRLRYPALEICEIALLKPEFILLSSEPYPFKEKHLKILAEEFPDSKVILVDGAMFSWYGVRPMLAMDYFEKLYSSLDKSIPEI